MNTFYLSPELWKAPYILDSQESRHLAQVLRIGIGENIRITDGQGREGIFTVSEIQKKRVILEPKEEARHPEPKSKAIIALAFSKAVRRGFFLEKAAELGAHGVWIWQADHSQGRLAPDLADNICGQMIAGMKQCGSTWLPQVRTFPKGIETVIAAANDVDYRILPWECQQGIPMLTPEMTGLTGTSLYVIGPEGGFSEREIQLLTNADFKAVSFGQRILRCETAATLCLGIHWWASQQPGR